MLKSIGKFLGITSMSVRVAPKVVMERTVQNICDEATKELKEISVLQNVMVREQEVLITKAQTKVDKALKERDRADAVITKFTEFFNVNENGK